MSSDSDSSMELHDIQWDEDNPIFDYNDPLSVSPQISAIIEDNVPRLKALLDSGKSVNINDNCGNTPLHVAVLKQKRTTFDYLLTRDDVRIDAANFQGFTPLLLAVIHSEDYYALTLIENGADVNVKNNAGASPLHHVGDKISIAQALVEKGANINTQDAKGDTPLYTACENGSCDFIHFLLYFGANPIIANNYNFLPFTESLCCCPIDVQEILFNFTFDKGSEVSLQTLIVAMKKRSPLCHKLVNMCKLAYVVTDLRYLLDNLLLIEPEIFKVFMFKYECVVEDLFRVCWHDTLICLFKNYTRKNEQFFHVLFESRLRHYIISKIMDNLAHCIDFESMSEDSLTRLLCHILSFGTHITTYNMNMIYKCYGFGELFKILLHMDIVEMIVFDTPGSSWNEFLMPQLIYNVTLTCNLMIYVLPMMLYERNFEDLVKFFAHPRHVKYSKMKNIVKNLRNVPSLLELSRESFRRNLIKRKGIKNSMQFHTVLNHLPINEVFKAIVRYEKPIYY